METNFQNDRCILVPTDFSEVCDNALNHAIEIAKYLNCKIYVLHVFDNKSQDLLLVDYLNIDGEYDNYTDYQEVVCKILAKYIKTKHFSNLVPVVREGELFSTIAETANEMHGQLIVLGTHGKVGFQNLFGSYALKVIDQSTVPVIVVQNLFLKDGYKHIIFPVSLEEEDRQKTEYAIKLAHIFNSTIHLFSKKVRTNWEKNKLNMVISQIASYFDANKVAYEIVETHEYGDTWEEQIVNYSLKITADMILIISNPKKHMMFFDAKEEAVIYNEAQIPVMCVNYKKTKISKFCSGLVSGTGN